VAANTKWFENTGGGVEDAWREHVYGPEYTHMHTFVTTGDVDGDGRLDLVVSPSERQGGRYRVSWFQAPLDRTREWTEHVIDGDVETVIHSVRTADMNNDGRLDIVTAEMLQGSDPDDVRVYLNAGGGLEFRAHVVYTGGSHSMRLVDVDSDGDIDMYGANHQRDDVHLWINGTVSR
jgi:hypothetical protein